jgi:hypothetical protein
MPLAPPTWYDEANVQWRLMHEINDETFFELEQAGNRTHVTLDYKVF